MTTPKRVILLSLLIFLPIPLFAKFPDVIASNPHAEAIEFVEHAGIVAGYADGTFQPDKTINRAEFVKIVTGWNNQGEKQKYIDMCNSAWGYTDVPANVWYAHYLCRATDSHIVGGYPDGTFRPDAHINFAEASKILALTDVPVIMMSSVYDGPWYKPSIDYLASKHVIPSDIHTFDQLLTRGQMAELIYRLSTPSSQFTQTYDDIALESGAEPFDVCTASPVDARVGPGTWRYPTKKEYESLGYLGEILTAEDCGPQRLNQVSAAGGIGWDSPSVELSAPASAPFLELLKSQYACEDDLGDNCLLWGNRTGNSPSELTKLRPFIDQLKLPFDSCLNCYFEHYIPQ